MTQTPGPKHEQASAPVNDAGAPVCGRPAVIGAQLAPLVGAYIADPPITQARDRALFLLKLYVPVQSSGTLRTSVEHCDRVAAV
jgi:hypothetical protein